MCFISCDLCFTLALHTMTKSSNCPRVSRTFATCCHFIDLCHEVHSQWNECTAHQRFKILPEVEIQGGFGPEIMVVKVQQKFLSKMRTDTRIFVRPFLFKLVNFQCIYTNVASLMDFFLIHLPKISNSDFCFAEDSHFGIK